MSFFKILLASFPLLGFAKSLEAMARSATFELRALGVSVLALGIAWAGYLYMKGGQEGKQKIAEVAIGGILILGGAAIVTLLKKVVGQ